MKLFFIYLYNKTGVNISLSNFRPSALQNIEINIDDKLGSGNLLTTNGFIEPGKMTNCKQKPDIHIDHWSSKNGNDIFAQTCNTKENTQALKDRLHSAGCDDWLRDSHSGRKVSALRAIYQADQRGPNNVNNTTKLGKSGSILLTKANTGNQNNVNLEPTFRETKSQNGSQNGFAKGDRSISYDKIDIRAEQDQCLNVWSNGACMTSDLLF